MTMNADEKYSIKNLLFYRAIPSYTIPVPIDGHKVFSCTDCCDRFVLESSYEYHINRKSLTIAYTCRPCNQTKIFYNRCNLLSHIRSHTFKTATINLSDLKIEPLPLTFFAINDSNKPVQTSEIQQQNQNGTEWVCFDCKTEFTTTLPICQDRAKHYMQLTNTVRTCPVCLFALPTSCALKAHLRLHTNSPPFYCPECGKHLSNKTITYPFTHHCEGFKMMRATARLECKVSNCKVFHPNDIKLHFKKQHFNKVYKCQSCVVACFNEQTMQKHLKTHCIDGKALLFFQCVLCPGRLVLQCQIDHHLKTHDFDFTYPCWECGVPYKNIITFIRHHIDKHCLDDETKNIYLSGLPKNEAAINKRTFRVIKRCEQCKRSFTYKCKYDEIQLLPNECPYKCANDLSQNVVTNSLTKASNDKEIVCPLCKKRISEDWELIKSHYAIFHSITKCLDVKIVLKRFDKKQLKSQGVLLKKRRTRKIKKVVETLNKVVETVNTVEEPSTSKNIQYSCCLCDFNCKDKQSLESHILNHKDPCMAYQCMECGQSFVVKPSFSTHLLVEHSIDNVEEYIQQKQCYNKSAMEKHQTVIESNDPVKENQCRICREQFNTSETLEKHFRMHGMAFLLKNTSTKNS